MKDRIKSTAQAARLCYARLVDARETAVAVQEILTLLSNNSGESVFFADDANDYAESYCAALTATDACQTRLDAARAAHKAALTARKK